MQILKMCDGPRVGLRSALHEKKNAIGVEEVQVTERALAAIEIVLCEERSRVVDCLADAEARAAKLRALLDDSAVWDGFRQRLLDDSEAELN